MVLDESDKGNNAFLDKGAFIAPHRGVCGHYASLGKSGNILLEDKTFRGKPSTGITVASWVNLVGTSLGFHSIFSTAQVMNIGQIMGKIFFSYFRGSEIEAYDYKHSAGKLFKRLDTCALSNPIGSQRRCPYKQFNL